jgi:hypothetical protein
MERRCAAAVTRYPAGNGSVVLRLIEPFRRNIARIPSTLDEIYLTPRSDTGEWESSIRGL